VASPDSGRRGSNGGAVGRGFDFGFEVEAPPWDGF